VWTAQATPQTIDRGNTTEVIEWDDASLQNAQADLKDMGPGDVFFSDANLDLEKFEPDVPELNDVLTQYINIMLSPLPAPKYMVGFAEGINRDVTSEQKEAYQDLVSQERRYQEKKWTPVLKEVVERQGLDPSGLRLKIEPETEENPVKTLTTDEIERMNTYISTLNAAAGPQAGPTALVSSDEILDVLDFPVDEMEDPEQAVAEIAEGEDTEAAWRDIMDLDEALETRYSEGDTVNTPQGRGVVSGVFTSSFDDVEASENSPTYAVALMDQRIGSEFYSASQLSEAEFPEGGPDDPTGDVEAMSNISDAVDGYEALDFTPPESWRESDIGPRAVALKAWAGMGGQFDCGGACCKGEMAPKLGDRGSDEFCASFKDYILGTEEWRGWG